MQLDTTPAALVQIESDCDGFPDIREGIWAVGERIGCGTCGGEHTITAVIHTEIAHNITILD